MEKDEVEYNRRPRQLVVSYMQTINGSDVSSSRSVPLANPIAIDDEKLAVEALDVLKKNTEKFVKTENCNVLNNPIKFLGISVGKFELTEGKKGNTIQNMFRKNMEAQAVASCSTISHENTSIEQHIDGKPEDSQAAISDSRPVLMPKNDNETTSSLIQKSEVGNLATNHDITGKRGDIKSFFSKYRKLASPIPFASTAGSSANSSTTSIDLHECSKTSTEPDIGDNSVYDENTSIAAELGETGQAIEKEEEQRRGTHSKYTSSTTDGQQPSTSASTLLSNSEKTLNYTQTYAEFQRPAHLQFEIPTTICTQCNQPVKVTELQSHADAHLAYQLSQEQRVEFRSQLKLNVKSAVISSPAPKRLKISTRSASNTITTSTSNVIPSIDRFLIKKETAVSNPAPQNHPANDGCAEPEPSTSNGPSIDAETCSECQKPIPIRDIVEHMDYHMARKLQLELQRAEMSSLNAFRSDISNRNNTQTNKIVDVKSKKKVASGGKSTNIKSVASFFTK